MATPRNTPKPVLHGIALATIFATLALGAVSTAQAQASPESGSSVGAGEALGENTFREGGLTESIGLDVTESKYVGSSTK